MENKHGSEQFQPSQISSIDSQAERRVRTSTANSDQKHLKTENTIKVQNHNQVDSRVIKKMIHIINQKKEGVRKTPPIHIIKNASNSNFGTLTYSNYPSRGVTNLINRSQSDLSNFDNHQSLHSQHKLMPS